ncbi:MAG: hypothetical protein US96_C0052G0004 [Candidatus Woesebacteria bacterium GW2011_GWB1_38_5b]|uniref:Uncharacterized protein n=1 Tax=Candidatus Woesebacteria bacterium GW2011_GWB1_38_5b TaxID=1618569 RepID=A0A0G0KE74_9BACT|nr:MAG: hypothetical protein US96_C0052G0004 [Candidatus Woesebacteria bacterium GW2011_GWB1_38_5b]
MFPLLSQGARFKNSLFLLKFSPIDGSSRFCFSISKKITKSAVVRNRLRRLGYRLLTKHISLIKPNTLVNFSFMKIPKDDEDVIINLESILKESKLIK